MGVLRERAAAQRELKLQVVEQQLRSGSLTIRQMTPTERKRHPKPDGERPPKRARRV